MNLHSGGRADRGPVTGSAWAEQDGGPRTRKGRSEAEDGKAVARTAWLRQDRGVDGAAIGIPKDEGGAERRRLRSRRGAFSGLIRHCFGIDRESFAGVPASCTVLRDPVMAPVATRVRSLGRRISYAKAD